MIIHYFHTRPTLWQILSPRFFIQRRNKSTCDFVPYATSRRLAKPYQTMVDHKVMDETRPHTDLYVNVCKLSEP